MSLHSLSSPIDTDHPLDTVEDIGTPPNDFDLDGLLAESLLDRQKAETVKAQRIQLAKGGLAAAEKEAIEQAVLSWELKREWRPQAAVVMFSRQQCQCCKSFTTQFLGFYERQQHRHSKADRWIKSVMPRDKGLPREAKYQDSHAELCEDCAEHLGFEVEEA